MSEKTKVNGKVKAKKIRAEVAEQAGDDFAALYAKDKDVQLAVKTVLELRARMMNVNTIVYRLKEQGFSTDRAKMIVDAAIATWETMDSPDGRRLHDQLMLSYSQLLEQVDNAVETAKENGYEIEALKLKNAVLGNVVKLLPAKIELTADKQASAVIESLFKSYKKTQGEEDGDE